MDKDIVGDLIAKAVAEAKALESQLDFKVPENEPAVEVEKKEQKEKSEEEKAEEMKEKEEVKGKEQKEKENKE